MAHKALPALTASYLPGLNSFFSPWLTTVQPPKSPHCPLTHQEYSYCRAFARVVPFAWYGTLSPLPPSPLYLNITKQYHLWPIF